MTLVFPECAILASFNLEANDMTEPNESLIIGKRAGDSAPQFA